MPWRGLSPQDRGYILPFDHPCRLSPSDNRLIQRQLADRPTQFRLLALDVLIERDWRRRRLVLAGSRQENRTQKK